MLEATTRLFTTVSFVACAALANSASTRALSPTAQSKQMLFGACGQTCGCPGSIAPARSVTEGRVSYSTSTASAASRAASGVSATMKATGSPTWRTAPRASTGWPGSTRAEPSRFFSGTTQGMSPMPSAVRSSAV